MSLLFGSLTGLVFNQSSPDSWMFSVFVNGFFHVGGQVFFAALKFLVVPVVFVSLVCGVGSLDDVKKMGWVGGKTMLLYTLTTAVAIMLAIVFGLLLNPGVGFNLASESNYAPNPVPSFSEVLIDIMPSNPFVALTEANMLQIIVMSILVGLAIALSGESGKRVLKGFQDINEVVMKLVHLVMLSAPIGVFCLLASVFAKQGWEAVAPLSKYFLAVLFVLVFHLFVIYGSLLKIFAKLPPSIFFRKFKEVLVFAFSTSSSSATLPVTMDVVENKLGVKKSIASFTLPLGATINMDGTAIMQGMATIFISQAYGIDIGMNGYLMVILTATLASIGTAGVPGVGLVTLAMVLQQVNLPVEGIGLIIGVDRFLDMVRTSVNVCGDAIVTCLVAKSEGEMAEDVFRS